MWKTVKLGDVAKFVRGLTYSKSDEVDADGIAVIRATNIDLATHRIILDEIRYISNSVIFKDDKYAKQGDLLICTASGSKSHLGKVALIEDDLGMTFGGFMAALRCNDECHQKFLYHVLTSKNFKHHLNSLGNGANINNLKFSQIEFYNFALPPLAEQQRIVAKLDAAFAEIDSAVALTVSKEVEVERLKTALLSNILQSRDYKSVKLEDICELVYGKALDKSDRLEANGIPAFGANGVKTYSKKALFDKPSIIVGRKGSAGELKRVTEPFWALDVTYYTKANERLVNLDFLYYTLTTLNLPSMARGVKPGINRNDVYELTIKLPPLAEQQRIVAKLDLINEQSMRLQTLYAQKVQSLISLKSAILAQELNPSVAA